jgi:hypothetical protein
MQDSRPPAHKINVSAWIKPACVVLVIIGIVYFFAREESKSLFRSDSNLLRSLENRWEEAGCPSGTNLDVLLGSGDFFLVNTQSFLVGTQTFQTIFTLRNPKINWNGGQLFVTTNKVLILHTDTGNQIVHWIKIWPGFDFVNLTKNVPSESNSTQRQP